MGQPWSDFTPVGKALIYLRDCLRFTKETTTAVVHNHMLNMIQKMPYNWTNADLTALATGCILLLAEKMNKSCRGELNTQTPELSETPESIQKI